MGEGMAVALAGAGVSDIQVANRTQTRAQALADRIKARAVPLHNLADALVEVDVLLTSTGSAEHVLTVEDVQAITAQRRRPLLIVDVAIPRDVEPAATEIDGVTLLDLDDLREFARTGLDARRREVVHVRGIIDDEVAQYLADAQARLAAPTVAALHEHAEQVRQAELQRFRARLDSLDERQRAAVEALTRGIVAKLLHEPTVHLKDAAGTPRGERLSDALRSLFDLD
jgi:glutamyl-tRNA reductase